MYTLTGRVKDSDHCMVACKVDKHLPNFEIGSEIYACILVQIHDKKQNATSGDIHV